MKILSASVSGPLRSFVGGSVGGSRRALPAGAHASAPSAAPRVPCSARVRGRCRTLYAHCVRCARTIASESVHEARCARCHEHCALRRFRNRPIGHHPPRGATWAAAPRERSRASSAGTDRGLRGRRYPVGAICAAATTKLRRRVISAKRLWAEAKSAGPGSARAARFVDKLAQLFEGSERSERSEFCARPRPEHRSEVGAQRRPRNREPLPGTAWRDAPNLGRAPFRLRPLCAATRLLVDHDLNAARCQ